MKPCSSFSPHAPFNMWSAATRRRMVRKAATSRSTPQTHPIGLNDDQDRFSQLFTLPCKSSNSHFGSKPRHFGMDAEIQAMDGNLSKPKCS